VVFEDLSLSQLRSRIGKTYASLPKWPESTGGRRTDKTARVYELLPVYRTFHAHKCLHPQAF
jgi:hypothetical protein